MKKETIKTLAKGAGQVLVMVAAFIGGALWISLWI